MPDAKSNRALEIGNELAGEMVKRHFTILPSLRSAICEEFEKIIPVLSSETAKACAEIVRVYGEVQTSQEAKTACAEIAALLKKLAGTAAQEEPCR